MRILTVVFFSLTVALAIGLSACDDGGTSKPDDGGFDGGETDGFTEDGGDPGGSDPGGSDPGGSDPGGSDPGGSDPGGDPGAAPIQILIDNLGIPHVFADNDENAFFGAGYILAKERLYQASMLRRFALGRLSEVLGEGPDGFYLLRDVQARTFDFPRWGMEDYTFTQTADPERAALISAWVAGINKFVQEVHDGTVPRPFGFRDGDHSHFGMTQGYLPEFWAEQDPYIILKGAGFANDKTIEFEIALTLLMILYDEDLANVNIFQPAYPFFGVPPEDRPPPKKTGPAAKKKPQKKRPLKIPEDQLREAFRNLKRWIDASPKPFSSNNWAVNGQFTANGKPLIAGDPHLAFDFFGSPYPMQINSQDRGGTYNVAGFAYPGTPGISLGFNDKMMWVVTTNMGDANDIWKVDTGPILHPDQVQIGGEWIDVVERDEQILVREAGDEVGQGRTEDRTYEDVPGYGVVVPDEIVGIPFAGVLLGTVVMNWAGFQPRAARWFMELNRISDLDDFEAAADRMREMSYNLIAADQYGIAYRVGLDVPQRTGDLSGERAPWKSMDGQDATTLWSGAWLPREQIPRSRALQRGWLGTANTDPWGFTADGRIDNDPWYYGTFFQAGYRGQRIEEEINRLIQRGNITLEDMQIMQMDTRSKMADYMLPLLADAHAQIGTDPDLAEFENDDELDQVVQLLTVDWDRRMDLDSAGALAWQPFMHFFSEEAVEDNISMAYDVALSLMTVFVVKVAAMTLGGEFPTGDAVLEEGRDKILLTAAKRAADWLKGRYGSVDPAAGDYTWGDMVRLSYDDAYGLGIPLFNLPKAGGEDTLNVNTNISFDPEADEWVTHYISVERSVGRFDDNGKPEVYVNYPVGPNADPDSADTQAAIDDYMSGTYKKFLFDRTEIEANLRERIDLYR